MAHSKLRTSYKLGRLCRELKISEPLAVGLLTYLWWSVDDATPGVGPDGVLTGWTAADVASNANWHKHKPEEFAKALCTAGFLENNEAVFQVHDYADWCPEFVKKRWKRKCWTFSDDTQLWTRQPVAANGSQRPPTQPNPTQPNPTQPNACKKDFPAGKDPPKKPSKRKPEPLWDIVVELFFPSGVAESERTRIGKVVRNLKTKNATPEQVRGRYKAAAKQWEGSAFGPEGLVNQWDTLKASVTETRKRKQLTLEGTE